jgi:hypothetical protein
MALMACALLAAAAASRAYAIDLTDTADSRLSCPDLRNTHQCAARWEATLSAAHPNLISRTADELSIGLLDGSRKRMEAECPECLLPVELLAAGRFLAIWEQWSEGNTWWLLDRKTGAMREIFGYPLLSPDGSRFAAVSTDLDAGFSRTILNIYAIEASGVMNAFEGISGKAQWEPEWGATNIRWRNNTTLEFRRASAPDYRLSPEVEVLILRDGNWRIEKAPS